MPPNAFQSERGSALVACIVVGLLFLTVIMWFSQTWLMRSKQQILAGGSEKARQYADSGVNLAAEFLKSPALQASLPAGGTTSFWIPMLEGRASVTLTRQSTDTNLAEANATGYYYIGTGSSIDPLNQAPAQIAVLDVKFRITNIAQFLMAVPGSLTIGSGTNAANGVVYANDLGFAGPGPTQVGTALYHNSISPSNPAPFVTYGSTPAAAQQLAYPPNFSNLDASVRSMYSLRNTAQLPLPTFDGAVTCPADTHVVFVTGDIQIGATQPVVVSGVCVIYSTGNVMIHNSITPADANSWLGVLSEGIIHLAADAPDNLSISGNFVTNVAFMADGPARPTTATFTLTGGVVSMLAMGVGDVWTTGRNYTYRAVDSPDLLLPNFSDILEYRIIRGKSY